MNDRIFLVIGFATIQYFISCVNLREIPERIPWIDISKFLKDITDSHLNGSILQKELDDKCRLNSEEVFGTDLLNKIKRDFEGSLQNNICILRSLKRVIEYNYNKWEAKPRNETNSSVLCCEPRDEVRDGCVLLSTPETNASDLVRAPFVPHQVVSEFTRRTGGLTVHYVAFNDGSVYIHPRSLNLPEKEICPQYDPRLRYFYTQTKSPGSRKLIIVVDRRQDTNKELLKEAVEKILKTLRPTDKVALCLPYNNTCKANIDSKAWSWQNHPLGNWYFSGEMFVASNINIKKITSSFDNWLNSAAKILDIDIINNYTKTLSSAHGLLKREDLSCQSNHITKGSCCQKVILVTSESEYCRWNISEMFGLIRKNFNLVFRTFSGFSTVPDQINTGNLSSTTPASNLTVPDQNMTTDRSSTTASSEGPVPDQNMTTNRSSTTASSEGPGPNQINTGNLSSTTPASKSTDMLPDNGDDSIVNRGSGEFGECKLNHHESDLFCESNSRYDDPVVTMPYVDGFGNGYIISICLPIAKDEEFLGVVCSDHNLVNLEAKISAEDVNGAYIFMVNSLGYTLMHPLLPPSYTITEDRTNINIYNLEQAAIVGSILDLIIQQSLELQDQNHEVNGIFCNGGSGYEANTVTCRDIEGVEVKSVGRPGGSNIPGIVKLFNKTLQYCWAPINNTDLTIALVLPKEDARVYLPLCEGYNPQDLPDFKYYHQPNSTERNCNGKQRQNGGSMIFAPNSFLDVASYVQNESSLSTEVNEIFNEKKAYHELMRKDLEGSVKLLRRADQLWRETSSEMNRYMGTADGAFISFLGKCLHKAFDHRNTPWYHRAVPFQQIDYISMSNPYFSECENRTVVTISQTLHDQYENPVAVAAVDFPFQDIIGQFQLHVPLCTRSICILVDTAGYVIFKSDWKYDESIHRLENDAEVVASHIIRIAPDIAWDMIGNYILQRRACHDYEENLTFYYWSFALKGKDTVYETDKYTVHKITHTSLFLVVRKVGATDGKCNCDYDKKGTNLECHDTCALECECPCKAGKNTIPCHNADQDVHRYPVPACKPQVYGGLTKCTTQ